MTAKAKLFLICESHPLNAAITIASLEHQADECLENPEVVKEQYPEGSFISYEVIMDWAKKVKEICVKP